MVGGSNPPTPTLNQLQTVKQNQLNTPNELITNFIASSRQGLSAGTLEFYRDRLTRAKPIIGIGFKSQEIKIFVDSLKCSNGGKHAYRRALRVFYHWLYYSENRFSSVRLSLSKPAVSLPNGVIHGSTSLS